MTPGRDWLWRYMEGNRDGEDFVLELVCVTDRWRHFLKEGGGQVRVRSMGII